MYSHTEEIVRADVTEAHQDACSASHHKLKTPSDYLSQIQVIFLFEILWHCDIVIIPCDLGGQAIYTGAFGGIHNWNGQDPTFL